MYSLITMAAEESTPLWLRLVGTFLDFAVFTGMCWLLAHVARAPVLPPLPAIAVFALAVYGAAEIITTSEIAYPLSELAGRIPVLGPALYRTEIEEQKEVERGMLACPLCVGMWMGALLAAAGLSFWHPDTLGLVLHGLAGAAAARIIHGLVP
jgi:hypothetical protein